MDTALLVNTHMSATIHISLFTTNIQILMIQENEHIFPKNTSWSSEYLSPMKLINEDFFKNIDTDIVFCFINRHFKICKKLVDVRLFLKISSCGFLTLL